MFALRVFAASHICVGPLGEEGWTGLSTGDLELVSELAALWQRFVGRTQRLVPPSLERKSKEGDLNKLSLGVMRSDRPFVEQTFWSLLDIFGAGVLILTCSKVQSLAAASERA